MCEEQRERNILTTKRRNKPALSGHSTFFRYCPSCGRRFEVRLVGKKLVEEEEESERRTVLSPLSPYYYEVGEDAPLVVDFKEFLYAYRCKHCGHQWSEIRGQRTDGEAL